VSEVTQISTTELQGWVAYFSWKRKQQEEQERKWQHKRK